MAPLSHDEFFVKLAELFASREGQDHGAVHLSQKRYTYPDTQPQSEDEPLKPAPLLIRASNAKGKEHRAEKIKISTIVEPSDLDVFYGRYAEVCRGGMTSLKPRDRNKKKASARKKKKGGVAVAA